MEPLLPELRARKGCRMAYGLEIAILGIAVVFTFLTILVLSMHLLGWFFARYGAPVPGLAGSPVGEADPSASSARVAAIVAALVAHRGDRGR